MYPQLHTINLQCVMTILEFARNADILHKAYIMLPTLGNVFPH